MTTKTDGGPAFPFGQTCHVTGQLVNGWGSEGMSLRDHMAIKFAAAWVRVITAEHATESREAIAIEANRLGLMQADHMLAQREIKP